MNAGFSPRCAMSEMMAMLTQVFELGQSSQTARFRVSVLETTRPEKALVQREALALACVTRAQDEELDEVLLFVVDVLQEKAIFLPASSGGSQLVNQAWQVNPEEDGSYVLPGVLSRKKQIVPGLESVVDTWVAAR